MARISKTVFPLQPVAFQVMIKPVGPLCNLNCSYCYYLEKQRLYPDTRQFLLDGEILERFIRQNIEGNQVPVVQFVWQGGEPALAGIDYYRRALKIQEKYAGNKQIENVFQTNGTLLNDEWCRFFYQNRFLVGVSLDGPKEMHDRYRVNKGGAPTWEKVMAAIALLRKHHVEFNTLTVLNDFNARFPLEVYHFLKESGSGFIQFLPVAERLAVGGSPLMITDPLYTGETVMAPWSLDAELYGDFLVAVFDEWVRNDVGKVFVQQFDVTLANWAGEMPGLCVFSAMCGDAPAIEHNGDVYSCDHFVFPQFKLGNILEKNLAVLIKSEQQLRFGADKKNLLVAGCIDCDYRFACHGGCPKNRYLNTNTGQIDVNYFCSGYKKFFSHVHPFMQFMSDELKNKRPPANVMEWVRKNDFRNAIRGTAKHYSPKSGTSSSGSLPGRNDPCFCGSGMKFKNCCMSKLSRNRG